MRREDKIKAEKLNQQARDAAKAAQDALEQEEMNDASKLKRQVMDSAETAKDMAKDAAANVVIKAEEGLHAAGKAVKSKVEEIKKGSGHQATNAEDK